MRLRFSCVKLLKALFALGALEERIARQIDGSKERCVCDRGSGRCEAAQMVLQS